MKKIIINPNLARRLMETNLITLNESEEPTVKCISLRQIHPFEEILILINVTTNFKPFESGIVIIRLSITSLIEVHVITPSLCEVFEVTYFLRNLKKILCFAIRSQKAIDKIKEIIESKMLCNCWPYTIIDLKRRLDEHSQY